MKEKYKKVLKEDLHRIKNDRNSRVYDYVETFGSDAYIEEYLKGMIRACEKELGELRREE